MTGRENGGRPVLDARDLRVSFPTAAGVVRAVDGVTLTVGATETLGLIGESGCGKSVTAQALIQTLPPPGRLDTGQILLTTDTGTIDLARIDPDGETMRDVRGRHIGMVFQEPAASLTPVLTVGAQLREIITQHRTSDSAEGRDLALEMLQKVGMPNPRQQLDQYPHQLSGGLAQRAMIALALCCRPRLLIADEPTTALDPVRQTQILDLIGALQAELGMSVIHISHDLAVIAGVCDRVAVMYLGQVVEVGPVARLLKRPLHPYTARLVAASPTIGARRRRLATIPGRVPVPLARHAACGFVERCDEATIGTCDATVPALVEIEPAHSVRCFLHSAEHEPRDR